MNVYELVLSFEDWGLNQVLVIYCERTGHACQYTVDEILSYPKRWEVVKVNTFSMTHISVLDEF